MFTPAPSSIALIIVTVLRISYTILRMRASRLKPRQRSDIDLAMPPHLSHRLSLYCRKITVYVLVQDVKVWCMRSKMNGACAEVHIEPTCLDEVGHERVF